MKGTRVRLATLFFLLLAAMVVNVLVGSSALTTRELWDTLWGNHALSPLFWQFRLPKAVTCIVAGGALGIAGLLMQSFFRNPLAGPDVLGLTAGAGLSVAIVTMVGAGLPAAALLTGAGSLALTAALGSGAILLLMLVFARKVTDPVSLLLVGLMVAATSSALVGVIQYLSPASQLQMYFVWTMGSVGGADWTEIQVMALALGGGVALAFSQVKALNTFLLGDNYALSLGIRVRKARLFILAAASLLVGSVTAFCGPIAFVGLAVPHLVRLLIPTANHRILLPATAAGGACLLLVCDTLTHIGGNSYHLPINAVTSLLGAPVVIFLVVHLKTVRI